MEFVCALTAESLVCGIGEHVVASPRWSVHTRVVGAHKGGRCTRGVHRSGLNYNTIMYM